MRVEVPNPLAPCPEVWTRAIGIILVVLGSMGVAGILLASALGFAGVTTAAGQVHNLSLAHGQLLWMMASVGAVLAGLLLQILDRQPRG